LGVTGLVLAHLIVRNFTANAIQNIHMIVEHMWSYIECWYWFWRTVSHIRLIWIYTRFVRRQSASPDSKLNRSCLWYGSYYHRKTPPVN